MLDINRAVSEFQRTGNLVPTIPKSELERYRDICNRGLSADEQSMKDWLQTAQEAQDLARMESDRQLPFDRAANVQAPTLMAASMQFAARAYPTLMSDDRPAKVRFFGPDERGEKSAAAERASKFVSWQLTEGMSGWERELDLMLHALPLKGCQVKKVYFCRSSRKTVSRLVDMSDLVLNAKARATDDLRISHRLKFERHEVEAKIRRGDWVEIEGLGDIEDDIEPIDFLEQHCRLDIDNDGYPEPYIVIIHEASGQIARIQANYGPHDVERGPNGIISIKPSANFVFFPFLPDPEYPVLGLGLGHLMLRLGKSINTILNQLIDAGTLQNTSGGLINKEVRIAGGNQSDIAIDEWQFAEMGMVDRPFWEFPKPQPSPVLFSLLGFLVDMAKELSSTTDALTGGLSQNVQPTTLLALIEQGQKVYSSIYKRLFRSMRDELRAIFRVNAQNIPPETLLEFHGEQVAAVDFQIGNMDIAPTADPNMANDTSKMVRAGLYQQFLGDPFIDQVKLRAKIFEAAQLDISLITPPQPSGPDPLAQMEIEKLRLQGDKLSLDEKKLELEIEKSAAETELGYIKSENEALKNRNDALLKHAQAILAIASAEEKEAGTQLREYRAQLEDIEKKHNTGIENDERRVVPIQVERAIQGPNYSVDARGGFQSGSTGAQGGQAFSGIPTVESNQGAMPDGIAGLFSEPFPE